LYKYMYLRDNDRTNGRRGS